MNISDLEVYSFNILYEISNPIKIPVFSGNLFYNLFAKSLKNLYCVFQSQTDCDNCPKKYTCIFPYFFQGIIEDKNILPNKYKKIAKFPKMFTFCSNYVSKHIFSIEFNFIGYIRKYFKMILSMFKNVNKFRPFKNSKGFFQLKLVTDMYENIFFIFDKLVDNDFKKRIFETCNANSFLLHFITPTRIIINGKYLLEELNGKILTKKILERTELLLILYSKIKNLPNINDYAVEIIDKHLKWLYSKSNIKSKKKQIRIYR